MCSIVKTEKAYGTWDSPIDIKHAVATFTSFTDVVVDPKTQTIYYLEENPDGRCDVVRYRDAETTQLLLTKPYSARSFVQEYGGAAAIVYNNVLYFSNDNGEGPKNVDNRIYSLSVSDPSQKPKAITPEYMKGLMRYANFVIHPKQENLLVTLREDHTEETKNGTYDPTKIVNTICVVDTTAPAGSLPLIIVAGAGYYASPVFNSSGTKIAWQQWDLGEMPWQGGTIYVADVEVKNGVLTVSPTHEKVAGNKGTQCATFPRWISDTRLLYIVDTPTENPSNHFQNPSIYDTTKQKSTSVLKTPLSRDFSEPAWYLGQDPYAILNHGKYAAFTAFRDGRNIVYVLDLIKPSESDPVEIGKFDFVVAQHLRPLGDSSFVFTGSKSSDPAGLKQNPDAGGVIKGTVTVSVKNGSYAVDFGVLMSSGKVSQDLLSYLSKPIPMDLKESESDPKQALYVVLYKPVNPNYTGLTGEKPPCILNVHGGPTALEPQSLNWIKMFYTSRGYAWLDVNYRGASGYGRDYMDSLYGKWGEYDVEDCHDAARILADKAEPEIDGKRVAIRGGSAGGYTTLASITFATVPIPTFYKTTCSAYGGVTDPELLAKATEKFECKYIDILFGTSDREKWKAKSPVANIVNSSHEPNLTTPLLMLHGQDDNVVPPLLARQFLQAITQLLPSEQMEFVFFPKEGHHWLHEKTKIAALQKESTWYEKNLL